MKAANFLNLLLATALVLLCAKLYFLSPPAPAPAATSPAAAEAVPADGTVSIDSTDLAPGVSGFGGPVPVVVELQDGIVARVSPKLPNDETPAFFQKLDEAGLWQAWDGLPAEIAATAHVDAVASATYSSKAAIANVRAALATVSSPFLPPSVPVSQRPSPPPRARTAAPTPPAAETLSPPRPRPVISPSPRSARTPPRPSRRRFPRPRPRSASSTSTRSSRKTRSRGSPAAACCSARATARKATR